MRWIAVALAAAILQAQPAAPARPSPPAAASQAFDVASIKPSAALAPRGGFGMSPSGLFQVQGISLVELIQAAYTQGQPFYRFQVMGGPDWLDAARFDISASSSVRDATPAQTMAMVKGLLVDRFKVVVRQETRDGPIFFLTLANNDGSPGPRLRKSSLTCPGPGCDFKISPGSSVTAHGLTIGRLAFSMANFPGLGRIIVDRTGLAGGYDIDLQWNGDDPSIFTALREQLGLKLESSRGPVPMLIIERAEKPTDN